MNQEGSWLKLGFEDPNQQDGYVEKISMKLKGKCKVFLVNRITQPVIDVLYFYIHKTSILKRGNCFDPPGDDFEWDTTTHMQLFLRQLDKRRLLGHRGLKQDPKNSGKSSKFQYGHKQKVKRFDCKFKKRMSCPAIKWVSVGEPVQFLDKIKQKKDKYKLFSVLYENEHNHKLIYNTFETNCGKNENDQVKDYNVSSKSFVAKKPNEDENLVRQESGEEKIHDSTMFSDDTNIKDSFSDVNDIIPEIEDIDMSLISLEIASNDDQEQMEDNMKNLTNFEKDSTMLSMLTSSIKPNGVFPHEERHYDPHEVLFDTLELEESIEPSENSRLDSKKKSFVRQIGLTPNTEDFDVNSKKVKHTDRDHRKLHLIEPHTDSLNDKYKNLKSCCKTHLQNLEKDKVLKNLVSKHVYRWFSNRHLESCWINSCMQLMMCLFDNIRNQDTKGRSQLWKKIWQMKQKKGKINPLPIRSILFEKELERITSQDVIQKERLFHFAESNTSSPHELAKMKDTQRLGQQDCQDFFKCLLYNNISWPDVCSPFTATILQTIYCPICKTVSHQNDLEGAQSYIYIDAPRKDMRMDDLVNDYFNAPHEKVWTHEKGGCGAKTYGQAYQRVKNIYQQEFLIFIVNRLTKSYPNQVIKNNTKIKLTPTIDIVESKNEYSIDSTISIKFQPIAIIHQNENTLGSDTKGHYMADFLDYTSTKWVRTSDDAPPTEINFSDVSNQGYIFLYKNTHEHTKTRKLKPRRNY